MIEIHGAKHTKGKNTLEQRISFITIGVKEIQKARTFYETLGWKAIKHTHGEDIVFFQCNGLVLSLYPRDLLAKDIQIQDINSKSFSGLTLAYNVREKGEVQQIIEEVKRAKGRILKEPQEVFWGGYHAYFSDLDDYIWEVAYNPFITLKDDGDCVI